MCLMAHDPGCDETVFKNVTTMTPNEREMYRKEERMKESD